MDEPVDDIIVLRKDGLKISRKEIQNHTDKQIKSLIVYKDDFRSSFFLFITHNFSYEKLSIH